MNTKKIEDISKRRYIIPHARLIKMTTPMLLVASGKGRDIYEEYNQEDETL